MPDTDLDHLFGVTMTEPNPAAPPPRKCYRHEWTVLLAQHAGRDADPSGYMCVRCGKVRDETRRRINRNNRQRGANFERTVAKALNGRRTGPLGGRDDVVGDTVAVQTKKDNSLSLNKARQYLDELSRIYPTRTALVVHAPPGRTRDAVVIVRFADWVALHGQDGLKETA